MRYLIENNDYNIQYLHIPYSPLNDKVFVHAELLDKKQIQSTLIGKF